MRAITGNPEYVILNSTLRAHCEALYKFIQRNWATSNIFYVRRPTQDDDRLRSYFAEMEKNTASVQLRMKFVNIDNTQDISQVTHLMDSNSKTVILVGSLDENFGRAICSKLGSVQQILSDENTWHAYLGRHHRLQCTGLYGS